jgi:hypothetical protein
VAGKVDLHDDDDPANPHAPSPFLRVEYWPISRLLDCSAVEVDGGPLDDLFFEQGRRMYARYGLVFLDTDRVMEIAAALRDHEPPLFACVDDDGDLVTPLTVVAAWIENGMTEVEVRLGAFIDCANEVDTCSFIGIYQDAMGYQ